MLYHATYGEDLSILKQDQLIKSDPIDNRRRRTIVIKHGKELPSCGFTLQSYGLLNRKSHNSRLLTYVDHVENDGPAHVAGLRPGDVILSVNGISMENADHKTLVNYIRGSGPTLRMIVIFEDCCRKIDLHVRCLKLQNALSEKVRILKALEVEEMNVLRGLSTHDTPSVCGSGSENSILSCYSDERLYSTGRKVCYSQDTAFRNVFGRVASGSSRYSVSSSMPNEKPNLFSFTSQNVASDDVFLEAAMCNEYECSSLPSDLSRKKKPTLKTSSSDIVNPLSVSFEKSLCSNVLDDVCLAPSIMKTSPIVLTEPAAPKNDLTIAMERSYISENHLAMPRLPEVSYGIKARLSLRAVQGSLSISKFRDSFSHRVNTDFRLPTRRLHQLISNHVLVEDNSNADVPQLISLKRLCHDFRTSCLQQNLEQRRKSTDWMMSSFEPGFTGDNELIMSPNFEVLSNEECSLPEIKTSHNRISKDYQGNIFLPSIMPQSIASLPAGSVTVEQSCCSDNYVYINTKDEITKL